ncbi:hypothetical protein GCM10009678_05780 [Actinomadura kijaniata]|uniref:Bleomycin resistance protein n=1 Tax=Actinomadura namibiensis TaxID=182080 RepID=A0A7W3QKI6_ACTNM|nr:VOC family protein [Actinomadura namibiensis]MBA8950457.1 hypothetical protein [Actinomadura namibiensis]
MGEKTIPIFPCRSVDAIEEFYAALGFETTFKQKSPNPFVEVSRGELILQFFGLKKYDPAASMHMCYVITDDVDTLYEAFRSGLKASLGRVPTRGLPRIGALKDMTYGVRQFLLTDTDGNQLRIGMPISGDFAHAPVPKEPVARALHLAMQMLDSKEDLRSATTILDRLLDSDHPMTAPERLKALVMRADLAIRDDDAARARALLDEARALPLTDGDRAEAGDLFRRMEDLDEAAAS